MRRILIMSCLAACALVAELKADPPKDPADAARYAKDRQISAKNLKQIGFAFHYYSEKYGRFLPRDIADKKGKPLLSWRVSILPFLDEEKLYKEFKLDEPWDSENNKKLIDNMPKVYRAPRGKFENGH